MTNDEFQIKECFAYFGRTIYMAQIVEKGILNSLISSYENCTKTRFDELLIEKSQLTFGQLKREIAEKKIFNREVTDKIESFHTKRDWLVHNYWWDRAIEFSRNDLRYKIFDELDILTAEFEKLNDIIVNENNNFLVKKQVNIEHLSDSFSKLDSTPAYPFLRKLAKDETLIGMYSYEASEGFQIPVFQLEDNSYWTLCESGLTIFNYEIDYTKFQQLDDTKGIFPVKQFNPKPKKNADWEYVLDLKRKGLTVKVEPFKRKGKFVYKWVINKGFS